MRRHPLPTCYGCTRFRFVQNLADRKRLTSNESNQKSIKFIGHYSGKLTTGNLLKSTRQLNELSMKHQNGFNKTRVAAKLINAMMSKYLSIIDSTLNTG